MGITLDTTKSFLTRTHGDIIANYSWINDERALVLIPALRKNAAWYVVMESAAFKYDDPHYLAKQCVIACEVLGIEPNKTNWVRIATIINEGLPDLIRMPASPEKEFHNHSFGRMILRADGQVMAEELIRLEKGGANYA